MDGCGVPDRQIDTIRRELSRASLTVSAVAAGCLLISVGLAMFGGAPWESTRTVWTFFAVIAWIRSQLALTRIQQVVEPLS